MDNSVDKFPYFFAKTPIPAPFLPVKTQNRISFYSRIGSFIASKRIAWQIVAEIFRRNRFFVRSASRHVLKNIAQTTHFIEKRLFHRQGRLSPKNRESAFVYAPRGLSIPASRQEKTKKATACQRLPERRAAPSGRTKPRFSLFFRERLVSFGTEKTPQRKNGAATRTAENSHDRTIFLVSPALSRSVPQTSPNISTNLCPTRSQEVR